MRVLGLHGVYSRSHDASACLTDGAELLAYAEEERFLRSKKAFDHQPHQAIDYCLTATQTDVNDLTALTYGWQGDQLQAKQILPPKYVNQLEHELPVIQIPHHEAHAASVFYTAPFEESAVLVVDGQGETESTSIWKASRQNGLEKLASFGIEKSLGYFYAAVSNFCGLGSFGAGKLMGLAPYGQAKYVNVLGDLYHDMVLPPQADFDSQDAFFRRFLNQLYARGFPSVTYEEGREPGSLKIRKQPVLTALHHDMAASAQTFLEQEMLTLARQAKDLTGSDYLCMAGGVAMNCVTNSLIQDSGLFDEVFVQPGCEDCGVAMGSALALLKQPVELTTPHLGPAFSDETIGNTVDSFGLRSSKQANIAEKVAELLANDVIVGWFQGGLEYGPRALGGRSILAHPATTAMRDRVNSAKRREPWRPFGPSVLAERADQLFHNSHESKYMLRSFSVREEWRDKLAAVVHVDGSTRPQTVSRADNPRYYDLIRVFERLTGLPAVLNTSFNDYDEPIVATPYDAIKTFYSTGLGALAIGDRLIIK